MKKILMATAAFMLMMANVMLTSCAKDDDDNSTPTQESEAQSEYTVILYGIGGANIDCALLQCFDKLYDCDAEAYKKVNVVAQYKYSTAEHLESQRKYFGVFPKNCGSKTVRWVVDPTKSLLEQAYSQDNFYGADNADASCPDSLTNFINWAAKKYPAKKYMLIVCDHGQGYMPNIDLPDTAPAATRGLLFDDGYNMKGFTVNTLRRAIASADVKIETLYMWACIMNNLQYQFELKDVCDYVIAATYTVPGIGGALDVLPSILAQPTVDVEKKLADFCKADVEGWDTVEGLDEQTRYRDLTVTRTSQLDGLGKMMREFTDRLCDTYTNGTQRQQQLIDSCTAHAVKVQLIFPCYDVAKYMASIMEALPEVYGNEFWGQMATAFNNCLVAQYYSKYLTEHNYMVDYSILLGAQGSYAKIFWDEDHVNMIFTPLGAEVYNADGTMDLYKIVATEDEHQYQMVFKEKGTPWGSTLDETYGRLAFDRVVGWSRWLKLNRQQPNISCAATMNLDIPE